MMSERERLYRFLEERDPMQLDKDGNYYIRHVEAMTAEGLHAKSDIASELGWRDREIDRLKARAQIAADEKRELVGILDSLLECERQQVHCGYDDSPGGGAYVWRDALVVSDGLLARAEAILTKHNNAAQGSDKLTQEQNDEQE